MPYVYPDAALLQGLPLKGNSQCVWLIQNLAGAGHTSTWREGAPVKGLLTLAVGTAIATFIQGRYPSRASGNHAALYLGQDACALWVIDQWKHRPGGKIVRRPIHFLGACNDKTKRAYVDIGEHYAVIE